MGKPIKLSEEMMQIDFSQIARREPNSKARVRAIALGHIQIGKNKTEAGSSLGLNRTTVTELIKKVNAQGINGIYDEPRSGRRPHLEKDRQIEFLSRFKEAQKNIKGGRLTGYDAQKIFVDMGIKYSLSSTYSALHRLDLSWVTSRSVHPLANEEAQAAFKKTLYKK